MAGPRSNVSWNPPEVFEEYRLMRPLGSGAMGKVYLARDQLLDRLVAIKFVADDVPSTLARERFLREARAVARIQHPNVVAVFRTGILDDRPYLIEEFARGTSLDRLKLPFAWRRAAELALGLAKGLGAVHRHGVLHRDLKPANAILSDNGDVKLLDFGLAKLLEGEPTELDQPLSKAVSLLANTQTEFDPADTIPSPASSRAPTEPNPIVALRQSPSTEITMPGTILGTPLYMAPELWTGDPASTRSDVYALGAVMFELFSGRPPFTGDSVQTVMAQAVAKSAPSLAEFAPEVPPALVRVVDRCLMHDPGARFPGGEAVESALEDALTDAAPSVPITALPENPYVGLAAFQHHQRRLFFGRSAEIRTLVERLKNDRIVIVAGDSGVGKSSLCRAGVLPSLENALVFTVVPGREPLAMLESAIAATFMSDDVTDLGDRLRQLTATTNVILFVDQLEEIVTLAPPDAARAFAEALVRLLARTPRLRLLASVRSDFLTRVAALGFDEELMRGLYLLRPLSAAGVRDAVVGPAKAAGVAFESESMVEELVQAGVQHGSLPLLQFALSELWEKRDRARHLITAESLHQIGGVEGALNRHADRVLDELPHPQRDIARRVLTRFVTAEGTKASLTASDLSGLKPGAPLVVDALVRARLLTVREVEGGAVYELAHESMIRSWARIRSWLEADAERRLISERIARAAADWKRIGHDDALWGEAQLAEAARFELTDLGAQERAFLDASRGAIARQKIRRWSFLIGAPLALALAIGAANLQSQMATAARLDGIAARVQTDLKTGAAERVEIENALERAFASFDGHESAAGSEEWKRAQASAKKVDALLRVATSSLAAARSLDPSREDLKRLFLFGLTERAHLARALLEDERLGEIVLQLGEARGAFVDAPARAELATKPAGARVFMRPIETRPGQKWRMLEERQLGVTPHSMSVPPGSYLLRFELDGHEPATYPIVLAPQEKLAVTVPLLPSGAIPEGFVYVPPGRFLFGSSDPNRWETAFRTAPLHQAKTGPYFIAKHETTNEEWIEYLEAQPEKMRLEWSAGAQLKKDAKGWMFTVQGLDPDRAVTFRENEPVEYPRHGVQRQRWQRLPVGFVSAGHARDYTKWLRDTGRVSGARLCTDFEWERAARGADARAYTTGDAIAPGDANLVEAYPHQPLDELWGADEVGSRSGERSLFGADDLTGNVMEWVDATLEKNSVVARGASWEQLSADAVVTLRWKYPDLRDQRVGLRVCADVMPSADSAQPR